MCNLNDKKLKRHNKTETFVDTEKKNMWLPWCLVGERKEISKEY